MVISLRCIIVVMGFSMCLPVCAVSAKDKETETQKETIFATLSQDQGREFSSYVHAKNFRREEFIVCDRLILEKQGELKGFMSEMSKEFSMSPDKSYVFEKGSKSLYEISTNRVDKAGKPERSLVRKMKSDSEAQYVSRLMVARSLTEQQIHVLAQIREEKSKEFGLIDDKLRQTFKLDAKQAYRFDEKTGQVMRLPASKSADSVSATEGKLSSSESASGSKKDSAKK